VATANVAGVGVGACGEDGGGVGVPGSRVAQADRKRAATNRAMLRMAMRSMAGRCGVEAGAAGVVSWCEADRWCGPEAGVACASKMWRRSIEGQYNADPGGEEAFFGSFHL
jgi:hypothetical protein